MSKLFKNINKKFIFYAGDEMLNYDIEIYKGIMFVRLRGVIRKENINDSNQKIIPFIIKNGIKNVIFNLNNLEEIDCIGEDFFLENQKVIDFNKGHMIICNIPKTIKFKNKYNIVSNEIKAIRILGA